MLGCGDPTAAPRADTGVPDPASPARPAEPRLADLATDGYELDDGEALHAAAPDTFPIPPADRRAALRKGEIVKLVFRMAQSDTTRLSVERMWVRIDEVRPGSYRGSLDNDPVGRVRLKAGDAVEFEPRHVIDVYED